MHGEDDKKKEGEEEEEQEEEEEEEEEEEGGWEEGEGEWEEGEGAEGGEGEGEKEGEEGGEESSPMFVPTKGIFFQHDDRYASGEGDDQEKRSEDHFLLERYRLYSFECYIPSN